MARIPFDLPLVAINPDDSRTLMADWTATIAGCRVTVPMGFVTDGASIPRFLWRVCGHPFQVPRLYAALVHDYLYDGNDPGAMRKDADDLYREMLIDLGVSRVKAWVEWAVLRLFGGSHWQGADGQSCRYRFAGGRGVRRRFKRKEKLKMKKLMFAALVAAVAVGCRTLITAEKFAEQVLPIQQKVTINGEDQLITTHYQIASGGWYATARSPLYATEALEGLEIGVETNGSVRLSLAKYDRDVSSNAVVMVDGMMRNGANLVTAIGDAYVKIAGGGAQAATVMDVASKCYGFFADKGGDASKATVAVDDAAKKLTISDGSVCVECNEVGVCTDCQVPAAN